MFQFHSFTCSCPFFPESLIEETVFSIVYSSLLCQRLIVHRCVGLCLGFVSYSIDPSLFSASTILFGLLWWLRGKDSTRKLLEPMNDYSKVAGYKINTQKSLAFLYTNNEKSEREIKEQLHSLLQQRE